jgi:hypothetical protein
MFVVESQLVTLGANHPDTRRTAGLLEARHGRSSGWAGRDLVA